MSLNHIVLIGRLVKDPDFKYVGEGDKKNGVCNMRMAYDFTQDETNFIDLVAWGKQAENHANNLSKGSLIAVEGRLRIKAYETPDGKKGVSTTLVVNSIQYLERKNSDKEQSNDAGKTAAATAEDGINLDDLPF